MSLLVHIFGARRYSLACNHAMGTVVYSAAGGNSFCAFEWTARFTGGICPWVW